MRKLVCVVLGLALCVGGAMAEADKDTKATKDRKVTRKGGVVGKVKVLNVTKKTLTITTASGKDRTFTLTKKTKIVGPRGGISEDQLKDDRLGKGRLVTVVPTTDGKSASEVILSVRKKTTAKEKVKEKKTTDKKDR